MTKQLGRNPVVAKVISEAGIKKAVVVDFREAETMMENHIEIGNIGHLVQMPRTFVKKALNYGVQEVTVFSYENAKFINDVCEEIGITQAVILKVISEDDVIYPGQLAGFKLDQLKEVTEKLRALKNIKIVGVTSFPSILFDEKKTDLVSTNNAKTLMEAKQILNNQDINITKINMPSATCERSLPLIKKLGGTQAEPGHALTGTTPMHANHFDMAERPAYCYVSEVSHSFANHSFVYGGGYYNRGHLKHVLVRTSNGKIDHCQAIPLDPTNIDYYVELDHQYPAGSVAIMAFRTQMFVTRSTVALVNGLRNGKPELVGLFDTQGRQLSEGRL